MTTKKKAEVHSAKQPAGQTELLFERIRELVLTARKSVARGVDLVQVCTNFEIGRYIVEDEQEGESRAAYGKELVKVLADKLSQEFGRGFSKSNLEYMRRFFLLYQDRAPIAQLQTGQLAEGQRTVQETGIAQFMTGQSIARPFTLSWTHYIFLMSIANPYERGFYEIEASSQNWTIQELRRQFDSSLYERLALSRDKDGIRKLAQEGQILSRPKDFLKEPLVLEFLGLSEQVRYSESDLEAQRRQYPRQGMPALSPQQGGAATEAGGMVRGGYEMNPFSSAFPKQEIVVTLSRQLSGSVAPTHRLCTQKEGFSWPS